MDEPFGAVDPITRSRLQDEFLSLQQTLGKTIVFVTHDFDEALKLGDRIAVLREGSQIAQYDTPEQILAAPADDFVEGFIGEGAALKRLHFERVDSLWTQADPRAAASRETRRCLVHPARRPGPDGGQGLALGHRRRRTADPSARSPIEAILHRVHSRRRATRWRPDGRDEPHGDPARPGRAEAAATGFTASEAPTAGPVTARPGHAGDAGDHRDRALPRRRERDLDSIEANVLTSSH